MKRIDPNTQPLDTHQLITPRSGSVVIDCLLRFSENKKLITLLLLSLTPLVIYIEMIAMPNHRSFTLYVLLIILFSLMFKNVVLIGLFTLSLALLNYVSYIQHSNDYYLVMLVIEFIIYLCSGIIVSKLVVSLKEGRELHFRSIYSFLQIIQMKDHYTAVHSRHVAEHALAIAKEMNLSKEMQRDLYTGGLLHDIGKIGVPDHILLKPDRLTPGEFEEIKKHPEQGVALLQNVPYMKNQVVHDCVLYHHERYDGWGYPKGLKGKDIPLAGRILAVADTYDAVTTHRIYQSQRSPNEAKQLLQTHAGTQFDPEVVKAFIAVLKKEVPVYKAEKMKAEMKAMETVR
ncbi:HD-GYP domain-containing protein [Chryseomicrobium palamuruense]|uniref:HD-GYP domain-containing protein n=1 Tax=Chryseomicrobium palamuruense TaxID=682973 RepID=A0ABV8USE3_9BACL